MLDMAEHVAFLSNDVWSTLDDSFFKSLSKALIGKQEKLVVYHPRPHQVRAIRKAKEYFKDAKNTRGKLIMPCGSGKSLTGFWLAEVLKARTVVVAVPSLSLIQQTLPVWLREYAACNEKGLRWLCVCSDQTVTEDTDSVVVHTQDLGYPCLMNSKEIQAWLKETKDTSPRVIFATYQSGKVLAEAVRITETKVDLGIMDEAHKTVGQKDKLFSHLLFDENLPMKRRIFMTATERRFAGKSDEIISMDNTAVYGETFDYLSFKQALADGILSDYRIVTRIVSNADVEERINKNVLVHVEESEDHAVEAQMLASTITLVKSAKRLPIRHSVSFHNSVAKAKRFENLFSNTYKSIDSEATETQAFHVSGKTPASERKRIIREFAATPHALITNARCLTEGVDIPNIDCVLFADPRRSKVDIVQAVGRALRRANGKECGYVLIPVISHGEPPNVFVESEAFQAVIDVIRALATNDERIIDYFEAKREGEKSNSAMVEVYADEQVIEAFDIKEFEESIGVKVWKKITPLTRRYLSYDEAIKFVHPLRFKGFADWFAYVRGERKDLSPKPDDIPGAPHHVYSEFAKRGKWRGWVGKTLRAKYRSYDEAIEFVHKLHLRGSKEWERYCMGEFPNLELRPVDIPRRPSIGIYPEFYKRGGFAGWVGSGRKPIPRGRRKNFPTKDYLPYEEACEFVRTLKLNRWLEWRAYVMSGRKPKNIPGDPSLVYGEKYKEGGRAKIMARNRKMVSGESW